MAVDSVLLESGSARRDPLTSNKQNTIGGKRKTETTAANMRLTPKTNGGQSSPKPRNTKSAAIRVSFCDHQNNNQSQTHHQK